MSGFLLPLLLLGVMYFVLFVPQRKKQKAQQNLIFTLGPGDEVVTSGGIYGGVTEVEGDVLYLEIAPDIEIKVAKRAIADRIYRANAPAVTAAPQAKSGLERLMGRAMAGKAAASTPAPDKPDDSKPADSKPDLKKPEVSKPDVAASAEIEGTDTPAVPEPYEAPEGEKNKKNKN